MADFTEWEDEIREVWLESLGYGGYLDNDEAREMFELGADAFMEGWFDENISPEDRAGMQSAFFTLMEEFGLDVSMFDWDDWRDWYEAQSG
jgi:hypothetical protein